MSKSVFISESTSLSRYFGQSRTPYYAVVAALPLLVVYELLLTQGGDYGSGEVRNAADVWLRILLRSLGVSPFNATLAMILALILAIPVLRSRSEALQPRFFWWMLAEAVMYGFFLGIAINYVLAFIFFFLTPAPPQAWGWPWPVALPARTGFLQGLALSLGAGLFEEFFFRVILLGALLYLTRLFLRGWLGLVVSIAGAAFLFSVAHYVGPLGEPFEMQSFVFRWVAGLLFTVLFYLRGFAITAYAHAFYDIFVITGLFRIVGW